MRPSQLGSGGHAPARGVQRLLRAQGRRGDDPARDLERHPGGRRRRLLRQQRRRGRLRARLPNGRRPGRGQDLGDPRRRPEAAHLLGRRT